MNKYTDLVRSQVEYLHSITGMQTEQGLYTPHLIWVDTAKIGDNGKPVKMAAPIQRSLDDMKKWCAEFIIPNLDVFKQC